MVSEATDETQGAAEEQEVGFWRRRRTIILVVLGLLLVALGVFLWLHRSTPPKATTPIISPGGFPSTSPAPSGYRVKVQELGIDLPVVAGDGWTVPLFQAALYPGMKHPGEGGRSLLYAHGRVGMFGPLQHGAAGQHVDITRDNQSTLHYVIKQYFPSWSATDTSILAPADHEQVVLLTCRTYNPDDPRIVAVAEPSG